MPLDVLGCTRATLTISKSSWNLKLNEKERNFFFIFLNSFILTRKGWVIFRMMSRAGNRSLQLLVLNEEFLVSVIHQITLTTSLSFVHTARRSYRLNDAVKSLEIKIILFFL